MYRSYTIDPFNFRLPPWRWPKLHFSRRRRRTWPRNAIHCHAGRHNFRSTSGNGPIVRCNRKTTISWTMRISPFSIYAQPWIRKLIRRCMHTHTRARVSLGLVCIENDTRYRNTEGGSHRWIISMRLARSGRTVDELRKEFMNARCYRFRRSRRRLSQFWSREISIIYYLRFFVRKNLKMIEIKGIIILELLFRN